MTTKGALVRYIISLDTVLAPGRQDTGTREWAASRVIEASSFRPDAIFVNVHAPGVLTLGEVTADGVPLTLRDSGFPQDAYSVEGLPLVSPLLRRGMVLSARGWYSGEKLAQQPVQFFAVDLTGAAVLD